MELSRLSSGSAAVTAGRALVTALLVVALLGSGCATSSLWEPQTYHPSERPQLQLAVQEQTLDLLVQYQEQHGEASKLQPRAYWLLASTNSIARQGKPVFINPKDCRNLIPVPLLDEVPSTNALPIAGYVAVATPAQQGFDLYLDSCLVGRYYLPIYTAEPKATPLRVAATPFAAVGDTAIVVCVCAVLVALVVGAVYLGASGH